MASFNTTVYDTTGVNYNMSVATYIDGSNCIPMSGTKWYGGVFGNVMCSFAVDGGDSILGGNVIMTGDVLVNGITQFNTNPTCSVVPTASSQLANKSYVDTAISAISSSTGFIGFTYINISKDIVRV
jgi:hypothetical protein